MSTFWQGFASSLLGMIGLGSLWNPLSGLQNGVTNAQSNLQNVIATNPQQVASYNTEITGQMIQVMADTQLAAAGALQVQTTLIWGQLNRQNTIRGVLAMVVLLLLIFLLLVQWVR